MGVDNRTPEEIAFQRDIERAFDLPITRTRTVYYLNPNVYQSIIRVDKDIDVIVVREQPNGLG